MKDRWQFKVTTTYDRFIETEFISANSKEEIQKDYNEYLKSKGPNEYISEPFPVS